MKQTSIELLKPIVLIIIGLLFYYKALDYGFIWDDYQYILNNTSVQSGSSFLSLWTLNKINVDFWPLSYSFIWLINNSFGGSTYAFHLANLSLFIASALLIYQVLKKLNLNYAFVLSLIYIIHPFNTVLAIWSFQLKTNLSNALALISFLLLICFSDSFSRKKLILYILSVIFFTASLLAKTHLILLPLCYFLYLLLNHKKTVRKSLLVTTPYFLISLIIGLINLNWDKNSLPIPKSEQIMSESMINRLVQTSYNFLFYTKNALIPTELSFNHIKHNVDKFNLFEVSLLIILMTLLIYTLFIIFKYRKINQTNLNLLLSYVLLFPALGLFEIYYFRFSNVAEHYVNISLVTLMLSIIPLLNYIKNKFVQTALAIIYISYLGFKTYNYIPYFVDEKTLLTYTINQNPQSLLSYNILGSLYKAEGDFQLALTHYEKSLAIQETAQTHFNIATVFEKMDALHQARSHYESAEALNPYYSQININLGGLYVKLKNNKIAIENFEKAISKDPNNPIPYYNIGYLYETTNDLNSALTWYAKSYNLSPNTALFRDSFLKLKKILNSYE